MHTIPGEVIKAAVAGYTKYNIFASVTLAQWILESGFGEFIPATSNNPFGIKAKGDEPFVTSQTHEVVRGQTVLVVAHFRKFASIAEAFDYHCKLLATAPAYHVARTAKSPYTFANDLTGIYATDPAYGIKLGQLIRLYDLTQYDHKPVHPAVPTGLITVAASSALALAPKHIEHFNFEPYMWFGLGALLGILVILLIAAIIHFGEHNKPTVVSPIDLNKSALDKDIEDMIRAAMQPVINAVATLKAGNASAVAAVQTELDAANATIAQMTQDDTDTDAAVAAAAGVNLDGTPVVAAPVAG